MKTKTARLAEVKAGPADGLDEGVFEAFVSVFGNEDFYGDVVMPGAFRDALADWKAKGDPIPVVWSHMYQDPDMHIGVVTDAEEREKGLWVRGVLDLDDDARKAKQVYRLLKGRRVTQFSFTYDVAEGGFAQRDGRDVYELRKIFPLYEVGPTLIGANNETELLAVKTSLQQVKAGRALSAKNEDRLRDAASLIDEVLATLGDLDDGKSTPPVVDGRATAAASAKAEEPDGAKAEEPARRSPATAVDLAFAEFDLATV